MLIILLKIKGGIYIFKIIFCLILFLIIFIIIIPLKIEVKYFSMDETKKRKIDKIIDKNRDENYLIIYILGFIPLPKIKLQVKKNIEKLEQNGIIKNIINTLFSLFMELIGMQKINEALLSKKEAKKINESIYIKKLNLSLGFNFQDVIINSYIIAFVNIIIAMFISIKKEMFNYNDVVYDTYISTTLYNFKIYSIVKFNLANTIFVIIKVLIRLRKVEIKNGKRSSSNRRFNDDCYDVT